jgi:hypothetical protein
MCTIYEYLGAETEEMERQRDIRENPQLVQPYQFTFDYVYDSAATQEQVYRNTAKPAILSCLEVPKSKQSYYNNGKGVQCNFIGLWTNRDWQNSHNGRLSI